MRKRRPHATQSPAAGRVSASMIRVWCWASGRLFSSALARSPGPAARSRRQSRIAQDSAVEGLHHIRRRAGRLAAGPDRRFAVGAALEVAEAVAF